MKHFLVRVWPRMSASKESALPLGDAHPHEMLLVQAVDKESAAAQAQDEMSEVSGSTELYSYEVTRVINL